MIISIVTASVHIHNKNDKPKIMQQRKGDQVELRCSAVGYPTPRIEWRKDGKLVCNFTYLFI